MLIALNHSKPSSMSALKPPAVQQINCCYSSYLNSSVIAKGLYFTVLHYIATESSPTVKRIKVVQCFEFTGPTALKAVGVFYEYFTELELYLHEVLLFI